MNRPFIAVEIGNTTIRLGMQQQLDPSNPAAWDRLAALPGAAFDPVTLSDWLSEESCSWRVSSVHRPCESRLRDWVAGHRPRDDYRVLSFRDLPIEIDVQIPDRVGLDRLAAAVAVNRLRETHRAAIIVDAGTAITVDALNRQGVFLGGAILPGFGMVSRALAGDTDQLPLVPVDFAGDPPAAIGKFTEAAIRSGVFWGGAGAVRELRDRYCGVLGADCQLFVTGGDAPALALALGDQATVVPDLVLAGIAWASV